MVFVVFILCRLCQYGWEGRGAYRCLTKANSHSRLGRCSRRNTSLIGRNEIHDCAPAVVGCSSGLRARSNVGEPLGTPRGILVQPEDQQRTHSENRNVHWDNSVTILGDDGVRARSFGAADTSGSKRFKRTKGLHHRAIWPSKRKTDSGALLLMTQKDRRDCLLQAASEAKNTALRLLLEVVSDGGEWDDAAASPIRFTSEEMGVRRWLVDTGCGYNLLSLEDIEEAGLTAVVECNAFTRRNPVQLNTAGGYNASDQMVGVLCPNLDEGQFDALLLESTPNVISVGQRCVDYGYSFHWPAWSEEPYLESPSGAIIMLRVHNNVPYLIPEQCQVAAPADESDVGESDDEGPPERC